MCVLWLAGVVLCHCLWTAAAASGLGEGERLARAAGCVHCHTASAETPLAGGRHIATPFGDLLTPNLTPDPQTGLGGWRWEDFRAAVQEGRAPDGRLYTPAFPWQRYRSLTETELRAIWAWLQAQPAAASPAMVLAAPLPAFLRGQRVQQLWRALAPEQAAPASEAARLAEAFGHCQECHTPRDALGAPRPDRAWAGAHLPDGAWAPSLRSTDLRRDGWTASELAHYLAAGEHPAGLPLRSPMREVVREMTAWWTEAERRALAIWLLEKTEPPRRRRQPAR